MWRILEKVQLLIHSVLWFFTFFAYYKQLIYQQKYNFFL